MKGLWGHQRMYPLIRNHLIVCNPKNKKKDQTSYMGWNDLLSQYLLMHLLIIVSLTKQDILYGLWLPCDWQASTIVCPSGLIQSEQRRIKIPTLRPFSKYGPTSIVSALIEIPSATWPVHIMLRLIGWLIILNHYSPPMVYIYICMYVWVWAAVAWAQWEMSREWLHLHT